MRKAKAAPETLTSIAEAKTKLEAQIALLDREAKRLRDEERDAGRKVLMGALDRVRIAQMTKDQAKTIAEAIGRMAPADLVIAIGAPPKA